MEQREVNNLSIPKVGTIYWYIWSCMSTHSFHVKSAEWIGSMSDSFRLAKGNMFLTQKDANKVCMEYDRKLELIKRTMREDEERIQEEDIKNKNIVKQKRKKTKEERRALNLKYAQIYDMKHKMMKHPDIKD